MPDTMTSTPIDKAAAHYAQVLAEAQALAPAVMPIDVDAIDGLEVCNVEVGDTREVFEFGPFGSNLYLRIRCADLLVLSDKLRRLADDLAGFTFDERDAKARAEMVECPGCRTRIAPDDTSCGTRRCDRIAAQEMAL